MPSGLRPLFYADCQKQRSVDNFVIAYGMVDVQILVRALETAEN
jgi:hypothetical protein